MAVQIIVCLRYCRGWSCRQCVVLLLVHFSVVIAAENKLGGSVCLATSITVSAAAFSNSKTTPRVSAAPAKTAILMVISHASGIKCHAAWVLKSERMRESSHPPARRRPPFILCWDVDGYFRFIFGESGATEHNRARWMAAAHANPLIKRAAIFSLPQHCAMRRLCASSSKCLRFYWRRDVGMQPERRLILPGCIYIHSASFCTILISVCLNNERIW